MREMLFTNLALKPLQETCCGERTLHQESEIQECSFEPTPRQRFGKQCPAGLNSSSWFMGQQLAAHSLPC
jgi:hypothetical protein